MGHTLEAYKGSYIIDIYPGKGVWSSKIHEFLQPKKHVLLEPEFGRYSAFLRPLIEKDGSRYKHMNSNPMDWSAYSQIFEKGIIPRFGRENGLDAKDSVQKTPILVLANTPNKIKTGGLSLARYLVSGFCSIVPRHEIVNSIGPVKMLVWLADDEKHKLLPRSVSDRDTYSISIDLASNVSELAGSGMSSGRFWRDPHLEVESALSVCSRMHDAGLKLPDHRKNLTLRAALNQFRNGTKKRTNRQSFPHLVKLRKLEERAITLEREAQVSKSAPKAKLLSLKRKVTRLKQTLSIQDEVVDELEQVHHLETKLAKILASEDERKAIKSDLERIHVKLSDQCSKISKAYLSPLLARSDDRIAFTMNPPILQWDQREIEPLLLQDNEVAPPKNLALLNITPKTTFDHFRAGSKQFRATFIRDLFNNPSYSIVRALDNVAPAAAANLVPLIPSLHDPAHGGRMNLEDLRVRMLNPDLVNDIATAFMNWPFRPEKYFEVGSFDHQ